MNFDEYEAAAMRTAGPAILRADALQLSALGLCGESGEVAEIVKKHVHHKHVLDIGQLAEELGDILWYIARTCLTINITLEEIAEGNIRKLRARYPDGFVSERSINRNNVVTCPDCGVEEGVLHTSTCISQDLYR